MTRELKELGLSIADLGNQEEYFQKKSDGMLYEEIGNWELYKYFKSKRLKAQERYNKLNTKRLNEDEVLQLVADRRSGVDSKYELSDNPESESSEY